MAHEELKDLIEQGNKAIAAIRREVAEVKTAQDALSREKVARMEADLAANLKAQQDAEAKAKALENRLTEIETKANRPGAPGMPDKDAEEYKSAFVAFIRDPHNPSAQQKLHELSRKATDTRTSTAGSGGYALPEEISRDIAKQVQDMSPIRSIARVVQVGTPDYKELVDLNGFGFEWVGETGSRSQTNTPDLGECAPTFGTIAAKPEATVESLEDLFFNVEGWLAGSAVEQFSIGEGAAFVSGNGTNKPTGFLNGTPVATADSARAFGVLQYVATGQAAALATDAFGNMTDTLFALKAGYRGNARWVMNSATMASLAKVKDANDRPLLQASVAAGVPNTIHGYAVTIAEDMPAVAANAFPIAFGDFSRGYLIADRVGLRVVRDEVTKPGYVRYIISKRVGGKIKDSNAIKLIKVAAS